MVKRVAVWLTCLGLACVALAPYDSLAAKEKSHKEQSTKKKSNAKKHAESSTKKPSASALPIALSADVSGERARITVKGKGNPRFRVKAEGNAIRLNFNEAVKPDIAAVLATLAPFVTQASVSDDSKTLTLTTDKAYGQKPFISEDGSGFDMTGIDATRKGEAAAPPATETKPDAPAEPASPPSPDTAKVTDAVAPAETAANPAAPTHASPAPVDVSEANVASVDDVGSALNHDPSWEEVADAENDFSESTGALSQMVSDQVQTMEEVAAEDALRRAKMNEMQPVTSSVFNDALKALKSGDMLVQVKKGGGGAEFHFPWNMRTAAAVYIRGKNIWIVFNQPSDLHVDVLKTMLPTFIDELEQVQVAGHSVLRLRSKLDMNAGVRRDRDSHTWVVTITRRGRIPATSIPSKVTGGKKGLRPNLQVDMLQAAEAVRIPDTVVGDNLIVVPDYEPSEGVFPERRFVDFTLLRTAQGLVIEPINERIRLSKTRTGLKIGADKSALTFSDDLPAANQESLNNTEQNTFTFFPATKWQFHSSKDFIATRQHLQSEIVDATDKDALQYRMKLAGILLGNGYYLEALGMLDEIRNRDLTYYNDYQLAALHGAANFMAGRYSDAYNDFADATLDNEDEIDYWRRNTEVMLGLSNRLLDYLDFHEYYGKLYPPAMREKLVMIAGDQALAQEHYNDARKITNILTNGVAKEEELSPNVRDYTDVMMGRIYANTGHLDIAKELLEGVANRTKNNYYRANAVYALAVAQYNSGAIDAKELIKRLEPLRIIWRGDVLEVSILNSLGDLYVQEKDYVKGMRAWKELIRQYPDSPDALGIAQKMAQTFNQLFALGEADRLKPLQALALYYEFRDLTPIGKEGDKIIQGLADRLAMVDLLDRSAALLAHQVKYRLEGEERSRVGARLALLFLFNREPKKALEALQVTGYGNNPEDLQLQRAHLTAEAYNQLGDSATALEVIDGDFSDEAKSIRLDIYWGIKDWKNVAQAGEQILSKRSDLTAELTAHEAQTLLRVAVAYTFMDDNAQLKYLRDYFTPLLGKSPLKDSFAFITNDNGPITHNNLSQLSSDLGQMKFFLENYRKQVRDTGLSKTVE